MNKQTGRIIVLGMLLVLVVISAAHGQTLDRGPGRPFSDMVQCGQHHRDHVPATSKRCAKKRAWSFNSLVCFLT